MDGPEATRPVDTYEDRSPPRPDSMGKLKFTPQKSVRWFAPDVLAASALRVLISAGFGAFLDKRELQASVRSATPPGGVPGEGEPRDWSQVDEVWFDFIADTGDGFPAVYTVAWLAAQPSLRLDDFSEPLPRGDFVVLGGDEVYPVGDADAYENRFTRPYEASLPWMRTGNPELYAIPGNHDWYDGLTSFFRVFCHNKWIGGRRTVQTRSYFAVALPHRWWLWGIDIQLDSYIDQPQQDYFKAVDLRPGDKVILCTGIPSWYEGPESRTYKNLEYVERTLIDKRGANLVLSLSGDSHHYSHYVGRDDGTHKVTAGGGGAFTHPTHTLGHDEMRLPIGAEDRDQCFEQTARYPSYRKSRRLAWGAIGLPFRNASFMVVPGVLYLLLGWSSQFSLQAFANVGAAASRPDFDDAAVKYGWEQILLGLFRNPIAVLIILVFWAGLIGFAKPSKRMPVKTQNLLKWPLGTVHVAMHVFAVVFVGVVSVEVVSHILSGGLWFTVVLLLLVGALGGLVGGLVMGLYLAATCALLGAHGNEAFSAMRLTCYKNFLRLRVDKDGLTVYAIGVDRSPPLSKWTVDPKGAPEEPWIAPRPGAEPVARLIEAPFTINPRTT